MSNIKYIRAAYIVAENIIKETHKDSTKKEIASAALMAFKPEHKKEMMADYHDIKVKYTEEVVKDTVSMYYGLELKHIFSNTRKREIVIARQVMMYFMKKFTRLPFREIGLMISNKDHATVIYAIKTINNLIDSSKVVRSQMEAMEKVIINNLNKF